MAKSIAPRRIYADADNNILAEGSKGAAFLVAAKGSVISDEVAKAVKAPANKAAKKPAVKG